MDTEGLFAVDPDDIPLLVATGLIAVGCILLIFDVGAGHPLVSTLVVGGTIAFVILTLRRVEEYNLTVWSAAGGMVLGSILVSIEFTAAFEFDGPIGAALFLFGAIGLSRYLDD